MSYVQIIQRLPEEWRPPLLELVDVMRKDLREELAVRRQDFDALRAVVQELAEAQARTEQRMEELAHAQARAEQAIARLATEQRRVRSDPTDLKGESMERRYVGRA